MAALAEAKDSSCETVRPAVTSASPWAMILRRAIASFQRWYSSKSSTTTLAFPCCVMITALPLAVISRTRSAVLFFRTLIGLMSIFTTASSCSVQGQNLVLYFDLLEPRLQARVFARPGQGEESLRLSR